MDKVDKNLLAILTNDKVNLQAEVKQLEGKNKAVSKIKHDDVVAELKEAYETIKKLRKELDEKKQSESKLLTRICDYKEQISDLKSETKNEKVKSLKVELGALVVENRNLKKVHFKTDNKSETINIDELEQLKQKLSRKGTKWKRNEGKDKEVITMKAEGKTFKEITALTGISSATIAKILKNGKSEI